MRRLGMLLSLCLLAATPARAGDGDGGRAIVESIEIVIAESFPVQVFAVLRGHLNDGCTKITDIHSSGPVGGLFHIGILTQRPPEALCTQALVPFEHSVGLKAHGLPAGTYTVIANGVHASFTLRQDNILK